jgi:hypothetical protein
MISEIEIATSFYRRTRNDTREKAGILRQAQNERNKGLRMAGKKMRLPRHFVPRNDRREKATTLEGRGGRG